MLPRKSIIAHGRCQVRRVLLLDSGQLLTLGNDSFLRVWHADSLELKREARMPSPYLVAAACLTDGIGVGFANGNLVVVSAELEVQWQLKLHTDLLTDVLDLSGMLVSCSLDGSVAFVERSTRTVVQRLQFDQPLWQLFAFNQFVYAAGSPAVRINTHNYEVKHLQSFTMFQQHDRKLFGCSTESVRCLANNEPAYIECSVLVESSYGLLALTEKAIGMLELGEMGFMRWRVLPLEGMPDGYELRWACQHNEYLYIVSDQGCLYQFDLQRIVERISEKTIELEFQGPQ